MTFNRNDLLSYAATAMFASSSDDTSAKSALASADQGMISGSYLKGLRSPGYFQGIEFDSLRNVNINFNTSANRLEAMEVNDDSAVADIVGTGEGPEVTLEVLSKPDWWDKVRTKATGQLLLNLGAGQLNNGYHASACFYARKAQLISKSESDDSNTVRYQLTFRVVKPEPVSSAVDGTISRPKPYIFAII